MGFNDYFLIVEVVAAFIPKVWLCYLMQLICLLMLAALAIVLAAIKIGKKPQMIKELFIISDLKF